MSKMSEMQTLQVCLQQDLLNLDHARFENLSSAARDTEITRTVKPPLSKPDGDSEQQKQKKLPMFLPCSPSPSALQG